MRVFTVVDSFKALFEMKTVLLALELLLSGCFFKRAGGSTTAAAGLEVEEFSPWLKGDCARVKFTLARDEFIVLLNSKS